MKAHTIESPGQSGIYSFGDLRPAVKSAVDVVQDAPSRPPWAPGYLDHLELHTLVREPVCAVCGATSGLTRWLRYATVRCVRHPATEADEPAPEGRPQRRPRSRPDPSA